MSDPIVGIDLGTSNSVVAYCDITGTVRVLADEAGLKIHPSVVSFHPSGGVVVAAAAKQRKVIDPANTIYSIKRLLGRTFNAPEVQTSIARSPFQIKEGANQVPMIVTRGGDFAVPEISAIVLDHIRNLAATALDTEVGRAVVTVPANFNDAQRTATATAGAIAGITVMRVLNEPTAAALAYGHTRHLNQIIAVYDFGGGTFDVTLLKLADQVYEVLGTAGDSFLGGDDLDERIVDKMVSGFLAEHRIDLRSNEIAMMRLRAVGEQTKIELSRRSRAVVRIDEIAYGAKGAPLNLQIELTRDEFVTQVADIIDRTFPVCRDALKLAGLDTSQVDDIILVGGTTKIPYVRDQVSKFFAKAPRTDVNPEEAVAVGAALQASALERVLSKPSSRIPIVESTQTEYDYEFGGEEQSVTVAQGAAGEPTDPRAKLAEVTAGGKRAKKPSSIPLSDAVPVDDELEKVDTNVTAVPTAANPGAKRLEGAYSERGKPAERFEDKPGDGRPIGRMAQGKPANQVGPISKVPARTFGQPLPPVTKMAPKVDPRLRKSGLGPSGAPPPPPANRAPPPAAAKPAAGGSEPGSPAAPPHAETMAMEIPETPMPMVRTASGVGGPVRAPIQGRGRLAEPRPELDDPLGDDFVDELEGLREASAATPLPRAPQTFAAVDVPISQVAAMPEPPDAASSASLATTAPGPFGAMVPPATSTMPAYASPPAQASARPMPAMPPRQPQQPAPPPPIYPPQQPASPPPPVYPPRQPPPPSSPPPFVPLPFAPPAPPPFAPLPLLPPPGAQQPFSQHPVAQPSPGIAPMPAPYAQPVPMFSPAETPRARPPVVLDVTPRGLGIATVAGYCEELIRRNSRLPAEMRKMFTTSRDMQELVRIVVCQGESRRLENNVVLGDLVLEGLPPRPRGETSIEVTFTLDVSGILQVSARDAQTGAERRASVDLLGAMPDQDVDSARERLQSLRR